VAEVTAGHVPEVPAVVLAAPAVEVPELPVEAWGFPAVLVDEHPATAIASITIIITVDVNAIFFMIISLSQSKTAVS